MPKALSETERIQIKEKLIQEAMNCLGKYGVRKTTVDDLVDKVKISKGTFYLFYKTKEMLFYDAFRKIHDQLLSELQLQMEQNISPEKLTMLIFHLYKEIEDTFIPFIISNGEFQLLFDKLPKDCMESNKTQDDFAVEQLAKSLPPLTNAKKRTISAALRGIFMTMLHKEEIGLDLYDGALKIMIRGVVLQIFQEFKED